MHLQAGDIAELSRLYDEAMSLPEGERAGWLAKLGERAPAQAERLQQMLAAAADSSPVRLPKLPSMADADTAASAGQRVGPYELLREIGHGGMGTVWLARRADGAFERTVALKLPRLVWATGLARRMARERQIGALLEHPHIGRLYDAGVDQHGRPYIAMEYIDSQPLDVYCRELALDPRTRLKLFVQVVRAVAYAHGRLSIHRDLKPANVLVDAAGQPHLLDFGIAKLLDEANATGADLTQEQGRLLTLSYAASEQIAGQPLGVTADIWLSCRASWRFQPRRVVEVSSSNRFSHLSKIRSRDFEPAAHSRCRHAPEQCREP